MIDVVHNIVDFINLHWKAVIFFLYTVGGITLWLVLRNKLQNQVMQDIASTSLSDVGMQKQIDAEEKVHLLLMTVLVIPVMLFLLRLFCSNIMQYPATAYGYFIMIFYLNLVVHHYREKLLLAFFKSKGVTFFLWLGSRLEREIYQEKIGCLVIVILLLIAVILNTVDIIPNKYRLFLFLPLSIYYCFRSIALIEGPLIYIQEVESIKDLRSTVGEFDVDDRLFLPLFPMLLLAGLTVVSLVGACVPAPDLHQKSAFVKGCAILKSLIVK